MNKKSEILFITYEYPYGKSETFIENEITYLAQQFSTIWILPSRSIWSRSWFKKNKFAKRTMPKACKLLTPKEISIGNYISLLKEIFLILLKSDKRKLLEFKKIDFYFSILSETIKAALLKLSIESLFNKSIPKIIYSYWKSPAAISICLLKQKELTKKIIIRCHGGDLYLDRLKYPCRPYDNYIAKKADYITPISLDGLNYLKKTTFPLEKLKLARLGVKIHNKNSQQSTDGILRIVSCSNIIPLKRIHLIAEALCKCTFPFLWIHFGDGNEKDTIQKITKKFPNCGEVIFMGRVPNSEIINFYHNNPVDIFINVSESEGVPVSIMEALAAGIPCIATDVGGTSEILNDKCGVLLKKEISPIEITFTLSQIVENIDEWNQKRQIAKFNAINLCSAKKNFSDFSIFLKNLNS